MAPMLEVVTLADSPAGAAFEVLIKRGAAAETMTPGRARLEGYSRAGAAALPRLLRSKVGHPAMGLGVVPQAIKRAEPPQATEKPWTQPAKAAPKLEIVLDMKTSATVGRTQELRWQRFVRRLTAHTLSQKILATAVPQLSRYTPASRQARARAHNERVERRAAELKQASVAHTEERLKKVTTRAIELAPAAKKAASHNRKVFQRMVDHKKCMLDKAAQLKAKEAKRALDTLSSTRFRLEKRSAKAHAHNEKVRAKMIEHQQAMVKKSTALRERVLRESPQLPTDNRKEKASRHNSRVLQKQIDRRMSLDNLLQKKRGVEATKPPSKTRCEKAARHNQLVMIKMVERRDHGVVGKAASAGATHSSKAVALTTMTISRRSRARAHNERVARAAEAHRSAAAEKARTARQAWGEEASAVRLRTSTKWTNRALGARKHNTAVDARGALATAEKARRAKEVAEKLEAKAAIGEKVLARRMPGNKVAGTPPPPPTTPTGALETSTQTNLGEEQPRQWLRMPSWLSRLLPCGSGR